MNIKLIKFLSKAFSKSSSSKFPGFARFAAFVSVVFGTMALILSISILSGFEKELKNNAIKFTSHIILSAAGNNQVVACDNLIQTIKNENLEISSAFPIIEREGLIKYKNYTDGASIRGVNSNFKENPIFNSIIHGKKVFTSDSAKEIILGARLAKKLNVEIGASLILFSITNNESSNIPNSKAKLFKVIGIYETGMAAYDGLVVYIPFHLAGEFFNVDPGNSTKIEIYVKNIENVNLVSKQIEKIVGSPYYCLTYYDIHKAVFSWIEIQKEPIPIVLGIISIVAALNVITSLLITVVEKTNSIGALRSLGLNDKTVIFILSYKGLAIGLFGSITGCLISYILTVIQNNYHIFRLKGEIYFLDSLPIDFSLSVYISVIVFTTALSLAASYIPARIAVKISPVKALRFK